MLPEILDGILGVAYDGLTVKPQWSSVTPGPAVLEECCGGQLWVTMTDMSPRVDRRCIIGWDITVTVGIARCVAVVDDRGNSPSLAAIRADALQLLTDAEDLQRALSFNVKDVPYVQSSLLGQYTMLEPEAGCAGGTWTLTIIAPHCAPAED